MVVLFVVPFFHRLGKSVLFLKSFWSSTIN